MVHPENHRGDQGAQKQLDDVREQQSKGSGLPSTTSNFEIYSPRNDQPEARVGSGADEALPYTEESAVSKDRPRLAELPQRPSRVRFSLDVERRPVPQSPRTRSSLDVERQRVRRNESSNTDCVSAGHGLSDDNQDDGSTVRLRKSNMAVQTEGLGADQSAKALSSAKTLSARLEPTSPTSDDSTANQPNSPKARNRGYSLRRMIFNRNINPPVEASSGSPDQFSQAERTSQDRSQSRSTNGSLRKDGEVACTVHNSVRRRHVNRYTRKGGQFPGAIAFAHKDSYVWKKAKQTCIFRELRRAFRLMRKFILRINEIPPSQDGRHIALDVSGKKVLIDERTGKPYISNSICSTRYTLWNFLPRQLVAQFSKLANFYFLSISILQMIPGLSTTGTYTTIAPLLFFVALSIAKEGIDDLRRHKLDKEENNRDTKILCEDQSSSTGDMNDVRSCGSHQAILQWKSIKWKDAKVGDIIHLSRDEPVPADLILLNSAGLNGIAYVETMALDGETSLKAKQVVPSLVGTVKTVQDLRRCSAELVVEDPNIDLYNFEGRFTTNETTFPLTNTEVMYRGSVLRNTPEALALIIYSGEECKIRMNANKNPRIKAPTLQKLVNRVVIFIVGFVIFLAIFCTVAHQIWLLSNDDSTEYLFGARISLFPLLTSFIIMLNTMIPLSLYVSLEIIKLAQMFLLNDIDMYDEKSNIPFEARTSTINEELGQISYIFSDKTGTLTDNSMKFRKISVAGTAWLHDVDLLETSSKQSLKHKQRKGKKPMKNLKEPKLSQFVPADEKKEPLSERITELKPLANQGSMASPWKSSARPAKPQRELRTMEMIRYILGRPYTLFAKKARLFLLSLALCHTCLPEVGEDGSTDFQASSPDELAIIRAAQELGYLMIDRQAGTITIRLDRNSVSPEPLTEVYEVLDVIEFSSARKRMSVIVRFPDQRICLFCKGADSTIMERLRLAGLAREKVAETERRTSKRKSLEAQQVLRRKSEQVERTGSIGRQPSFALSRPSISGFRKPSTGNQHSGVLRAEIDEWLKGRELDVEINSTDESLYYTPRPSAQLSRKSMTASEARSSGQFEDEEELVEESLVADESAVFERCFQHINDFATEGLRTLMFGYRFLDAAEYSKWQKVYQEATTSLVDRRSLIEQAAELVEHGLELAGATAIEDKLQAGVPMAIDKLRRANIKLWMLTGDKRETAVNIGYSCRLVKDYSSITILDCTTGDVEHIINAAIQKISEGRVAHSVVIIDGQTLATIENEKNLNSYFFDLIIMCDAVICCRASPSQKAGLVRAVRKKVNGSVTLAIGDGANDVAMIQEAHVGIGIMGKEGSQAARSSDYSIAQFRFLLKLLLVHGRWNYVRTCKYTVGTFWKEVLFYLTQCIYQRWNGYTGTSLYENWSLSMFNTLFTSLPVLCIGIFEKDLAASTLLAIPELYTKGQRNEAFNFRIYFAWMFMASLQSVAVFYIMFGIYGKPNFAQDRSLFSMGQLTYSACVILISSKLQLIEQHNKSILAALSAFISIGGWFLWNIVFSETYGFHAIYHVRDAFLDRFGSSVLWWGTLLVIVVSCTLFEVAIVAIRTALWPTDVDTFQALERDLDVRKRFEEAASVELQQGWHRRDSSDSDTKNDGNMVHEEMLSRNGATQCHAEQAGRENGTGNVLTNRVRKHDEKTAVNSQEIAGGNDFCGGEHKNLNRNIKVSTPEGNNDARESGDWGRSSLEIQELLAQRFGSIRR